MKRYRPMRERIYSQSRSETRRRYRKSSRMRPKPAGRTATGRTCPPADHGHIASAAAESNLTGEWADG